MEDNHRDGVHKGNQLQFFSYVYDFVLPTAHVEGCQRPWTFSSQCPSTDLCLGGPGELLWEINSEVPDGIHPIKWSAIDGDSGRTEGELPQSCLLFLNQGIIQNCNGNTTDSRHTVVTATTIATVTPNAASVWIPDLWFSFAADYSLTFTLRTLADFCFGRMEKQSLIWYGDENTKLFSSLVKW